MVCRFKKYALTQATSRNPLEQPWLLGKAEFTRRVGQVSDLSYYRQAREETMSVTEEIVRVEREIDERVKGLYGL